MALAETTVRTAKATDKPYKLTDERGLYLLVNQTGKYWRINYRFAGKQKTLALGVYPDTTLKQARAKRDEARSLLSDGIDPGEQKQKKKAERRLLAENSLSAVAEEWLGVVRSKLAANTLKNTKARLENNVLPWLGKRPIAEITAPDILAVLRKIASRGAIHTAHKAKHDLGQVFRYAIATGRAERDPTGDLRGALPAEKTTHFAAITDPKEVSALLRAIDAFKGSYQVQAALRLSPMLFVRPGELRTAEWAHIDLDKAEWRYTVSKTNTEHLVPLSTQAVAALEHLKALTGDGRYVFPGARTASRPMSDAAVNAALRRMGYDTKTEITGHGFRAMARTILHEELHQKPEVIEHQLAHRVTDNLGTAYNRTKFLKERKQMMQLWADYLDKLKAGAEVIQLQGKTAA
ncbi:MAG: integrase arm-type DNA-binding domain-containing protein [Rhodocyclaceae bacterium]|nr:integrase arm-type DNA-binding domain-containing protein [Rhodocyclaceae bacterium]